LKKSDSENVQKGRKWTVEDDIRDMRQWLESMTEAEYDSLLNKTSREMLTERRAKRNSKMKAATPVRRKRAA